ncbi:hypothetical protein SDC9_183539 [bioreactor metagenome]|uniref:Uncharacterized protein n=1 Tax=bioreactor metagenome TaxID=1076179 RepID=A0A645HIT5_9ZZZZ
MRREPGRSGGNAPRPQVQDKRLRLRGLHEEYHGGYGREPQEHNPFRSPGGKEGREDPRLQQICRGRDHKGGPAPCRQQGQAHSQVQRAGRPGPCGRGCRCGKERQGRHPRGRGDSQEYRQEPRESDSGSRCRESQELQPVQVRGVFRRHDQRSCGP